MGHSSYSVDSRSARAETLNYAFAATDSLFEQNVKRMIHESMDPKGAQLREARDSVTHPNSLPISLNLDVTGSMRQIPEYLVRQGLPKIMAGIIEHGIPDPALLFMGIGDTTCDHYPLQVGQFESGDAELDTWLTRIYLEGGGGGNEGESYLLAWYFAAYHTATDAWDKRKQKGFLFTVGDEPCLKNLPKNILNGWFTGEEKGYTDDELLKAAQEKWNVYHLHMMEGTAGHRSLGYWRELLGDNCIQIDHKEDVSKQITDIVTTNAPKTAPVVVNKKPMDDGPVIAIMPQQIIL